MQSNLLRPRHTGVVVVTVLFYGGVVMTTNCPPQVDIHLFNCSNHQLTDIPYRIHPETKSLDLSHNNLAILHEDTFSELRHLDTLVLDFNRIFKITDKAMNTLGLSLEYLSLRGNRLSLGTTSDFPMSALAKLRRLKHLDLSENPLGEISPGWFYPLGASLQVLRISQLVGQTKLHQNAFYGLGNVYEFDISNNEFHSLPEHAFSGIRPEKLTLVNLRDIPWHCDCTIIWLRHWLDKLQSNNLPNGLPITGSCLTPKQLRHMPLINVPMTTFQCKPQLQSMFSTSPHYFDKSTGYVFISSSPGESVTLNCSFVSNPKMFVGWYKNGVLLRPTLKRFKQKTERGSPFSALLTISALHFPQDDGNYTCQSENNRGTAKGTFYLKVFQHPRDVRYLGDEAAPPISSSFPHDITSTPDPPRIFYLAIAVICLCALCISCILVAFTIFQWKQRNKIRTVYHVPKGVDETIDCTESIANKAYIENPSPQINSGSCSQSPLQVVLDGANSATTHLYATNQIDPNEYQHEIAQQCSPIPHRYAPEHCPEIDVQEQVRKPIVRTFAPFETYENGEEDDSEIENVSTAKHYDGDTNGDDDSVDEACPVHGRGAIKGTNYCPIHSQQSLDRFQNPGRRFFNDYKETSRHRLSTDMQPQFSRSGEIVANSTFPRGKVSLYPWAASSDLVFTNSD